MNNAMKHPIRQLHQILHMQICVGSIEKERSHEKLLQKFVENLKGNVLRRIFVRGS